MSSYDVIIVTSYSFPIGLASTNRIMSYAKEIAKNKKVLVLSFAQSNYQKNEHYKAGIIDQVEYRYFRPSDPARKTLASKIILRFLTVFNFYYLLLFKYKTKCVISYFHDVKFTKRLYVISNIRKFRIYKDITETFDTYFGSQKKRLQQCKLQRLYDGLIVMTKEIGRYFEAYNSNQFILPMGVDITRFSNRKTEQGQYFFYCSGGVLERDGLLDSLKGFAIFNKSNPNYTFKIATPVDKNDEYHQKVMNFIKNNSSIEYLGVVSSDLIPNLMIGAKALVVTPHHDYITKGFPTKLGEYLASGRPVICTSIPSLADNIEYGCTYMVRPNSPQEIANSMIDIVSNPEMANLVAEKGFKFVCNKYTVAAYLNDMLHFLQLD